MGFPSWRFWFLGNCCKYSSGQCAESHPKDMDWCHLLWASVTSCWKLFFFSWTGPLHDCLFCSGHEVRWHGERDFAILLILLLWMPFSDLPSSTGSLSLFSPSLNHATSYIKVVFHFSAHSHLCLSLAVVIFTAKYFLEIFQMASFCLFLPFVAFTVSLPSPWNIMSEQCSVKKA